MINFIIREDELTGKVKVRYTGDETYFQDVIAKWGTNSQSLPILLSDFLQHNVEWELNIKDGIFNIELFFLQETIGVVRDNKLINENIINQFRDVDKVYINGFYNIDKTLSTANTLWLDHPVENEGVVYKVSSVVRIVTKLTELKQETIDKTLQCNYDARLADLFLKIQLIENENTTYDQKVKLYNSVKLC